jgi:predicted RNase H-like nuclease (RuvC/YqgF family)
MAGEYKGKSIFTRRYIGMSEEAIREEIDRLQGQVYALEDALDSLKSEDKDFYNSVEENQHKLEKMVTDLDSKITKLQSSLDYDSPVKTHLDNFTKDISGRLRAVNRDLLVKLAVVLQVNTILLFLILSVVIYKFIVT